MTHGGYQSLHQMAALLELSHEVFVLAREFHGVTTVQISYGYTEVISAQCFAVRELDTLS